MSLVLNGTTGITSPGGDSAAVSVTTPLVTNAGTLALSATGANIVTASTNGTERMRIDSAGNVGIGKVPEGQSGFTILDLGSTSASGLLDLRQNGNRQLRIYNSSTGSLFENSVSGGSLQFWTGASERARIDSSGNVAIGGATNARRFTVYLNAATNYAGEFIQQSATGHAIAAVCNSSDTNGRYFDGYSDSAGASRIIIYSNGNVQNTNNSYGALSDLKLKENIVDATPKLDKLNQVRVVSYNLKDNPDQKLLGVVAQELEQIFPGMIEETSDFDREGNDLGTTTKSVKYSVFVPMLIKAMQEQQALITSQTAALQEAVAEINSLKARVEALEGAQA